MLLGLGDKDSRLGTAGGTAGTALAQAPLPGVWGTHGHMPRGTRGQTRSRTRDGTMSAEAAPSQPPPC